MLVAWRRVHRRKGMRSGGTAREESRGFGARGEDVGLGRHGYMWVWVCGEYKEDGVIKIEDWSLPEQPLIECGVRGMRARVGGCRPSLTGESDALWVLVFRAWWQQRGNCVE
jgi:hypothetical protein